MLLCDFIRMYYATVRLHTSALCYCMFTHMYTMLLYAYTHVYYATVRLHTSALCYCTLTHKCTMLLTHIYTMLLYAYANILYAYTHVYYATLHIIKLFHSMRMHTWTQYYCRYIHAQFTIVYRHIYSLCYIYYTTTLLHLTHMQYSTYLMQYCQVHVI